MRPVPSSKISIPELLPDLVHRTELLRQLDSAADVGTRLCARRLRQDPARGGMGACVHRSGHGLGAA